MSADVGGRIRAFRLAKHMTQDDLAEEVGVTRNAVSYWELNRRTLKIGTLEKIAAALNIDPGELLGEGTPLGDAPTTGLPDLPVLDPGALDTVEEAQAEIRNIRAAYQRAVEVADAGGWTPETTMRVSTLSSYWDRLIERQRELEKELNPVDQPLAMITEREGEPAKIRYLREPTPEERARLMAQYPDAVEVEAEVGDTLLVWQI